MALRAWLKDQGLKTDDRRRRRHHRPAGERQTLETFKAGDIDGAWVPEPWATRLIQEGGGKVLVDERDLWPEGKYVTTHLIVATKFLDDHPDVVKQLIEGQVGRTSSSTPTPAEAQTVANDEIEKITGKPLKPEVIEAAWENLTFTDDPIAAR